MPLFTKRIIRPGTYTVPRADGTASRVHIGPQRINRWLTTFQAMQRAGLAIPAPWRHDENAVPVRGEGDRFDTDAYNNAGFWKRLWVDDKDGALYGEVDVPRETDADRLGRTVTDVSLLARPRWIDGAGNRYEDALTHIALVTHPVAKDHDTFRPSPLPSENTAAEVLACGLGDLIMADDVTPDVNAVKASSATVVDVLGMLSKMDPPIVLPSDTDSGNFLERLVTALSAIQAVQDVEGEEDKNTSISEPPKGSKEKPGPIAMATDPTTPEVPVVPPVTPETPAATPEPLSLSAADQASINFATKTLTRSYQARIEECVKQGKITPKLAQEQGVPLLAGLSLAFDVAGEPVKGPIDLVLEAWEAIPSHAVLTGRSPASVRATKGSIFSGEAFSLAAGLEEVPGPDLETPPEGSDLVSDADADAIVDAQFKNSGFPSSRLEGGYRQAVNTQ